VSELLDLRVIGAAGAAAAAVGRLPALFELDRQHGPYPSRKAPELARFYLAGRLRPTSPGTPARAPLEEIEDRKAARDLGGELAAITGHWAQMEAQPWWPPKVGDVAIGHPEPCCPVSAADPRGHAPDCPAARWGRPPYGATFLAVAWPRSGEVRFCVVSSTVAHDATTPRGGYGIEELWFEWAAVSLVRAGTLFPPPRRGAGP
jgi:hypothetical protein